MLKRRNRLAPAPVFPRPVARSRPRRPPRAHACRLAPACPPVALATIFWVGATTLWARANLPTRPKVVVRPRSVVSVAAGCGRRRPVSLRVPASAVPAWSPRGIEAFPVCRRTPGCPPRPGWGTRLALGACPRARRPPTPSILTTLRSHVSASAVLARSPRSQGSEAEPGCRRPARAFVTAPRHHPRSAVALASTLRVCAPTRTPTIPVLFSRVSASAVLARSPRSQGSEAYPGCHRTARAFVTAPWDQPRAVVARAATLCVCV